MTEGTEREAKKRQGQNWPGKKLLPNFCMKIKVAPFVFTNHWLSIEINLFLWPGVPLTIPKFKKNFEAVINFLCTLCDCWWRNQSWGPVGTQKGLPMATTPTTNGFTDPYQATAENVKCMPIWIFLHTSPSLTVNTWQNYSKSSLNGALCVIDFSSY